MILNLLFSVTQTYEEDIPDYMLGGNYLYTETEATESTTLRPYIDPSTPTNVTVIKGKTAMLACVVRNVGKAAVSRFFRAFSTHGYFGRYFFRRIIPQKPTKTSPDLTISCSSMFT